MLNTELDLKLYSEEEIAMLLSIVLKDLELRSTERQRLNLKKMEISSERVVKKDTIAGVETVCSACNEKFRNSKLSKIQCSCCCKWVCRSCITFVSTDEPNVCSQCINERRYQSMSCGWFYSKIGSTGEYSTNLIAKYLLSDKFKGHKNTSEKELIQFLSNYLGPERQSCINNELVTPLNIDQIQTGKINEFLTKYSLISTSKVKSYKKLKMDHLLSKIEKNIAIENLKKEFMKETSFLIRETLRFLSITIEKRNFTLGIIGSTASQNSLKLMGDVIEKIVGHHIQIPSELLASTPNDDLESCIVTTGCEPDYFLAGILLEDLVTNANKYIVPNEEYVSMYDSLMKQPYGEETHSNITNKENSNTLYQSKFYLNIEKKNNNIMENKNSSKFLVKSTDDITPIQQIKLNDNLDKGSLNQQYNEKRFSKITKRENPNLKYQSMLDLQIDYEPNNQSGDFLSPQKYDSLKYDQPFKANKNKSATKDNSTADLYSVISKSVGQMNIASTRQKNDSKKRGSVGSDIKLELLNNKMSKSSKNYSISDKNEESIYSEMETAIASPKIITNNKSKSHENSKGSKATLKKSHGRFCRLITHPRSKSISEDKNKFNINEASLNSGTYESFSVASDRRSRHFSIDNIKFNKKIDTTKSLNPKVNPGNKIKK